MNRWVFYFGVGALALGLDSEAAHSCEKFRAIRPVSRQESGFQSAIEGALDALAQKRNAIARETLQSICTGRVALGEISDLTQADFWRLARDDARYGWGFGLRPQDYTLLKNPDSALARKLRENLSGYTWHDRIYLSLKPGTSPRTLSATLVHEVNHVLNQSTLAYYLNDYYAFIEEYRAFYVEFLYLEDRHPSAPEALRIMRETAEDYGFKKTDYSKVPTPPPGELRPTPQAWKKRAKALKQLK